MDKRLRWRCRRGVKELDLILQRFLDEGYGALTADQRSAFDRLLDSQDDQLLDWFTGREEPTDGAIQALVEKIRRNAGI